jgi:hypothetical protein
MAVHRKGYDNSSRSMCKGFIDVASFRGLIISDNLVTIVMGLLT